MKQAAFGAGCFWGVQYQFDQIEGVTKTVVGYMGGKTKNPSYKAVCTDKTGHAETVYIEFDENIISYDELLDVFWRIHNPAQKNRQGLDVGSQYRSVIFYYTPKQKELAERSKEKVEKEILKKPVATEIVAASSFYPAEEYHQKYLEKNGAVGCPV